jgi:hypothetical protein
MSQTKTQLVEGLDLAAAPADSLVIDSSGRVGIGISSPVKRLQVSAGVSGDAANLLLVNTNDTDGDTASILFSTTNTDQFNKAGIFFERTTTQARGSLHFCTENTGDSTNVSKANARLTITRTGAVGIGTTSPQVNVDIAPATSSAILRVQARTDTSPEASIELMRGANTTFGSDTYGDYRIKGSGGNLILEKGADGSTAEVLRTDGDRLLIGTPNSEPVGFDHLLQLEHGSGNRGISLIQNTNDAFASHIDFAKSRSTGAGGNTIVQNGDGLGSIVWRGADGSDKATGAAYITCQVDGTPSSNDMPGRLIFATTLSGASSSTEVMRITQDGLVDLGHGSGPQARFRTNATSSHQFSRTSSATTNLTFIEFGRAGTAPGNYTPEGDIRTNGSGNLAFNNASDITLKENIRDLDNCLETVNSLRPVLFDWKEEYKANCTDVKGFIAQEFEQVLPKSVSTDENGIKSIAPETDLLPLLVGALKEATAKITALEAKVAALEAN